MRRTVLTSSAKDLGPYGPTEFGFGLADAYAAVMAEQPPVAASASAR